MAGEELLGPLGALVGALGLVGVLGRLHLQEDERQRKRTMDAERRLDDALSASKEHANVSDRAVALAEQAVDQLGPRRRWSGRERRDAT